MAVDRELVDTTDNEDWEDIPETNLARDQPNHATLHRRSSSVASSTPGTPRTGPRRRRITRTRVVQVAQPQLQATQPRLRSPKQAIELQQRQPRAAAIDREDVQNALIQGTAETVRYFGAVLTHALWLLRWPFTVIVALCLLSYSINYLHNTLRPFVAPFCIFPGISSSALCRPPQVLFNVDGDPIPQRADYPELVKIQASSFEQLLDGSVGGSGLSLEIKKAEMASKDLITLVKFSELKSKDLLADSLFEFVEDAKMTGKGLQKLTSKVNGAVDKIMAINDYALHTIEGSQNEPNSLLQVIWPFASSPARSQELVVQAFRDSMDVHAAEMRRLVLELAVSEANLERLDTHLVVLHELCTRENLVLSAAREDLLAELWTLLGGNRRRLRGMDGTLELLRDLGEYRKRAAAHVAAAKQTLMAMGEDMEDLRERVAAPDIVGDRIPIEVHMKSIQSGLERLKEDRIKAREREEQLMNRLLGVEA